jgi:RHS repeat-associated protein
VPDENPSALGAFEFPLRFPGQYADKETNLFYNYFRDYDSAIGRYIQADLLGIAPAWPAAGLTYLNQTYAYADGSPLRYFDSKGLLSGGDVCMVKPKRDCYAECAHLLPSPSGDLQASEFRKCYRECVGSL